MVSDLEAFYAKSKAICNECHASHLVSFNKQIFGNGEDFTFNGED